VTQPDIHRQRHYFSNQRPGCLERFRLEIHEEHKPDHQPPNCRRRAEQPVLRTVRLFQRQGVRDPEAKPREPLAIGTKGLISDALLRQLCAKLLRAEPEWYDCRAAERHQDVQMELLQQAQRRDQASTRRLTTKTLSQTSHPSSGLSS
jgi:hypothetical protein